MSDPPFTTGGSFSLSFGCVGTSVASVPDLLRVAGEVVPFVDSFAEEGARLAAGLEVFSPLFFSTVHAREDSLTGVVAALRGCIVGRPKTSEGDRFREGVPPGLAIMLRSIQERPLADMMGCGDGGVDKDIRG